MVVKALVLDRPRPVEERPLRLTDIAPVPPGPGEVLVRVRACGVCRTDLHLVEGELPMKKPSVIPGHQIIGEVAAIGDGVRAPLVGERVGIAWLSRTCGRCRFCQSGRENLCMTADFTGWTVDGGFAEYARARADFAYALPDGLMDLEAAPLMCAGIIGYRALRLTGLDERGWRGARVGLYGFGAAGHVAIQLARVRGAEVHVVTRDQRTHGDLAMELGAASVGPPSERPPALFDAAIVFAPAGELVPIALSHLDRGGVLVLGGIHMSAIPSMPYELLYDERVIRSVANNTRDDGRDFLAEAARVRLRTSIERFDLADANEALLALKRGAVRGAAVLACPAEPSSCIGSGR